MTRQYEKPRVGEVRPSQLLFSYGVGALVDLPYLSVLVMGLDDWNQNECVPITEERLLAAVQSALGKQVTRLLAPPVVLDTAELLRDPTGEKARRGVPVATFPRWLVCTHDRCRLLGSIRDGFFDLKPDLYRPERTHYEHTHCSKHGARPLAIPARFLIACPRGHLDDFPWQWFVHKGAGGCEGRLRFEERGASGEAADIFIHCESCKRSRSMAEAFGERAVDNLPTCRARRAHLRDFESTPCEAEVRAIRLGASNLWFPCDTSLLSIPPLSGAAIDAALDAVWRGKLEMVPSRDVLEFFLKTDDYRELAAKYTVDDVWSAIERRRSGGKSQSANDEDLKDPEWAYLSDPTRAPSTDDFRLRAVRPPANFEAWIAEIVLVERLREVRALTGFLRVDSEVREEEEEDESKRKVALLSRSRPTWVPASEVRGEGIFLRFHEDVIESWASGAAQKARQVEFERAHETWCAKRFVDPSQDVFPGMRYVLLHSFAHALIRELSLECGYSAASLRERLYVCDDVNTSDHQAGILIYTAAPDSEGTLGGLVRLGEPEVLGPMLANALQRMRLCAADPLCAEHAPDDGEGVVHGAACHACSFVAETSCESGNRFLDRSALVATVVDSKLAMFRTPRVR